jgi:predicted HicB family RNase H-like nuclease
MKRKSGGVLTEADVEALADQFERGVDLSKWRPRPGRPSLSATPGEHSPRIAVRVPAELHRRVLDRAEAEGLSLSQVMRRLLESYAGRPSR